MEDNTKYTGKNKKFDFTAYKAVLDEAFRDLEEANLPQPDQTKVFFLLNGIESDQLKRVKDGVVTNPLVCNNYYEATLYILRCIAHDNTVDVDAKLARNIMTTSSTGLSTRNYTAEEWKHLTKDQRSAIIEMRNRNRLSGRGGNSEGTARGQMRGGRFSGDGRGRGRGRGYSGNRTVRFQFLNNDEKASPKPLTSIMKRSVSNVDTSSDYVGDYHGPYPTIKGESQYDSSDNQDKSATQPSQHTSAVVPYYGSKIRRLSAVCVRHISYSYRSPEDSGRAELDSHADNCLLGRDALVLEEYLGEKYHLYGYKKENGYSEVHMVKAALAHDLENGSTIILIFDQSFYDATLPNSIINPNQMRENGVKVDDTPLRYGGTSHSLHTTEGFTIQLYSKGHLSYFSARKPTAEEMASCPHFVMTGSKWDPHSDEFDEIEQSHRDKMVSSTSTSRVDAIDPSVIAKMISRDDAEKTLKATTILAIRNFNEPRYSSYGHRFRWLGRRQNAGRFWTDPFFAQRSISGFTCAQLFINEYRYIHIVPMKGRDDAPYTLRSFFDSVGLPDLIIRDNSKEQSSQEWRQVLREFGVLERPIEAYKPHQNYAENGVLSIKFKSARIMEQQGVPNVLWDDVIVYASTVKNRTVTRNPRLEGRTPYEIVYGVTPDISALISFTFYDHIWYYDSTHSFPDPRRLVGR